MLHVTHTLIFLPPHWLLFSGAVLLVNSRAYELLLADEYSMKLMEALPECFPCADAARVGHAQYWSLCAYARAC